MFPFQGNNFPFSSCGRFFNLLPAKHTEESKENLCDSLVSNFWLCASHFVRNGKHFELWCCKYLLTIIFSSTTKMLFRTVFNSCLFFFCCTKLGDWLTASYHFLNWQWEAKLKPIAICSHAFFRHWRLLHVFALNSDLFIVLFKSVVIGQSSYLGFCFTTFDWKPP